MAHDATRDQASTEYFDALGRGELLVRRCRNCGTVNRADFESCQQCHGVDLTPVPAQGDGEIVSAITDHVVEGAPVVLALVELSEGPWVAARIEDVRHAPPVGTPVILRVRHPEATSDSESVPAFVVTRQIG
ncbi:Zn-ribbon domain-containing OB-fold protein [Actinomycetes bacterium M1A6_2h]